jgi:hypothetical protein
MKEDEEIKQMRKAAQQAARQLGQSAGHHHAKHLVSVRKAVHEGHRIEIRTTYEVRIDGRKVSLPLSVDSEGRVTRHSLPNYSFQSAIDLIKQVITAYPDDFPMKRSKKEEHKHGGHST